KNRTLANILRDVHYQANDKAEIRVYQKKKVIELRYATI
ncbi:MAG: DotD/TraH family lipoprotein, partial [Legionellales bacterium]|nr:DotD/TraH family lipoprotein [Legionellales bacterium]